MRVKVRDHGEERVPPRLVVTARALNHTHVHGLHLVRGRSRVRVGVRGRVRVRAGVRVRFRARARVRVRFRVRVGL